MSELKWQRELHRTFSSFGIEVTKTNGGHLKLSLPNGRPVFAASTPSDWRAIHNIRRDVRRALRASAAEGLSADRPISTIPPSVITAETARRAQWQACGWEAFTVELPPPPPAPDHGVVYHHACSAHLPLILWAGALLPGRRDGHLWATTDSRGDRLGCYYDREAMASGDARHVRFTCNSDAFASDWQNVAPPLMLEFAKRRGQSPNGWRYRRDELDIEETLIEWRCGNRWRPLPQAIEFLTLERAKAYGVVIDGVVYIARLEPTGVAFMSPEPLESHRAKDEEARRESKYKPPSATAIALLNNPSLADPGI
jgi:hypothetical protein